ncbi:MAG: hypothetical protein U0P48_01205 [Ancrocorticia sp.]
MAQIEEIAPDGVFFSNGPGDPEAATEEVDLLRSVLDAGYFFGICFGNQLLGRSLGYGTYKRTTATAVSTNRSLTFHPTRWRSPRTTTVSPWTRRC